MTKLFTSITVIAVSVIVLAGCAIRIGPKAVTVDDCLPSVADQHFVLQQENFRLYATSCGIVMRNIYEGRETIKRWQDVGVNVLADENIAAVGIAWDKGTGYFTWAASPDNLFTYQTLAFIAAQYELANK